MEAAVFSVDGGAFRRFGPQVVKAVRPRGGPLRKGLKGDDSVIAGCDICRGRVYVPVIKVVKLDPQERVEETTTESPPGIAAYRATAAAESVASTVVKSVGGCEVRLETESNGYVSENGALAGDCVQGLHVGVGTLAGDCVQGLHVGVGTLAGDGVRGLGVRVWTLAVD